MLRSMKVTNHLGESLTMELENSKASGFQVAGIDGLGPPKADIFMSDIAAYDGGVFNSARVDSRNIVIRLVYDGEDIEELRHKSYKYFPIKRNITLAFVNDTRNVEISGYVESNEVAIFTKMEGSVISVICPDPWFSDSSGMNIEQTFSSVDSLFGFEFYEDDVDSDDFDYEINPSEAVDNPDEDDPYIEFGSISSISSGEIQYEGDMEVGVTIRLKTFGQTGDLTISNVRTREQMVVSSSIINRITGSPIKSGDEIFITTMQGNKSAKILRAGTYKNIIAAIDKTSDWFKLSKGGNSFVISQGSGNGDVEMSISNVTLYEGI